MLHYSTNSLEIKNSTTFSTRKLALYTSTEKKSNSRKIEDSIEILINNSINCVCSSVSRKINISISLVHRVMFEVLEIVGQSPSYSPDQHITEPSAEKILIFDFCITFERFYNRKIFRGCFYCVLVVAVADLLSRCEYTIELFDKMCYMFS